MEKTEDQKGGGGSTAHGSWTCAMTRMARYPGHLVRSPSSIGPKGLETNDRWRGEVAGPGF